MIVVADTSVVLNLCRMQHERLLQQTFKRVLVPCEVAEEFARLAKVQPRFAGLVLPDWIEISSAPLPSPPEVIQADLDAGESAAIALCLEQHADALLIDESAGRAVANQLGLRVVGIVGILIDAKNDGLISSVTVLLGRLEREAGFWISAELRRHVLQLAGE